jgi:rod shape-determining protein MreD
MVLKKVTWRETLVNAFWRIGLISFIVFVLLVLGAFPLSLGGLGDVRPFFVLIAVYYWAMTRPQTLPMIALFLIGIFYDLIAGYPLGITALILLAAHWIVRYQRRFLLGQSFRVVWAGMAIVVAGATFLQWVIFSVFLGGIIPPLPVLTSALMTAAFFPLLVPLLSRINKLLAEPGAEG